MRSWPIWNKITSCAYKSDKSYGIRSDGNNTILVGTSSSNSHQFVTTRVTHKVHEDGTREYRFYLDGVLIKRAILAKGSSDLDIKLDHVNSPSAVNFRLNHGEETVWIM